MNFINRLHENEVIAEFLIAEVNSPRFMKKIKSELENHELSWITNPNLESSEENQLRKRLLGTVRGYGLNKDLFENFPHDIEWYSAVLTEKKFRVLCT